MEDNKTADEQTTPDPTKETPDYLKVFDDIFGKGDLGGLQEVFNKKLKVASENVEEEKARAAKSAELNERVVAAQELQAQSAELQARSFHRISVAFDALTDHIRDYVEAYRQFGGGGVK